MRYANGSTALVQAPAALMEALRFSEDDLRANRQGRLGDAQEALLRARLRTAPIMGLVMASLPISFVLMSLITLASAGELRQPSDPAAFAVVIVILFIALMLGLIPLLLTLRNWRLQRQVLDEGVVASFEGAVEIEVAGRRCLVTVADDRGTESTFAVPRRVESAFENCDRYRVYYLDRTRRMIAAECVDG